MPWDLNVWLSADKNRIPLHFYIQPWKVKTPSKSAPVNIPVELIMEIAAYCDGPTTWVMMHVCHRTRVVASKHFWSRQDTWYYCDASWWDSVTFGLPGLVQHCPEFAENVVQIEIDFGSCRKLSAAFTDDRIAQDVWAPSTLEHHALSAEDRIKLFWAEFQESFPSAKRVVLSCNAMGHDNDEDSSVQNLYQPRIYDPIAEVPSVHDFYQPHIYDPIAEVVLGAPHVVNHPPTIDRLGSDTLDPDISIADDIILAAPPCIEVYVGFHHSIEHGVKNTRLFRVELGPAWTLIGDCWGENVVMMPRRRMFGHLLEKYSHCMQLRQLFTTAFNSLD